MAGLVPAIHVLLVQGSNSWMPGTGPGVTKLVPRLLLRHELHHRLLENAVIDGEGSLAPEHRRVPVPAPAAVGMLPQVLLQPLMRTRARAMRQIGRHRIGGFENG